MAGERDIPVKEDRTINISGTPAWPWEDGFVFAGITEISPS